MQQEETDLKKQYIIFDGQCGLCNSAVRYTAKKDMKDHFLFVSSEASLGQNLLQKYQLQGQEKSTVILINHKEEVLTKSRAVIGILQQLPHTTFWKILLRIIPNFLRDWGYDMIASNRQLFISNKSCEIPTQAIRKKIISS